MSKETITPEKLTDSNFKDFGWVMKKPERNFDFETHWLQYWHNAVDLSNFTGDGLMGFMRMKRVPIKCEKLLVLYNSVEMYLSLDGKPSVVFVAAGKPGGDMEPDLNTLRAFILEDGAGVVVEKGVWHWSPFPLSEHADFALGLKNNVILQAGTEFSANNEEILYYDLETPIAIDL